MSPRRRRRRAVRAIAVTFLVLVVLALAGIGSAALLIDPNAFKARIEAAARRETGRDLVIHGRISLRPSLTPTIAADDVTFANAPGADGVTFANAPGADGADMATVGHIEADIALLPLLSHAIEVSRLVLTQPRLLLETAADGKPNWAFRRPPPPPTDSATAPEPAAPAAPTPWRVAVRSIAIRDGDVTWRDAAARSFNAKISRLDIEAPTMEAPSTAHADFVVADQQAVADVTAGSLARLLDPSAATEWPLKITARWGAVNVTIAGTLRQPSRGAGYDLQVDATTTDPAALGAAFGRKLPPLPTFSVAGHVSERSGDAPTFSDLSLVAGPADLGDAAAGLELTALRLTEPSPADPLRGEVSGRYRGADFSANGTFGTLAEMLRARATDASAPIDFSARFAGADIAAKGTVGSLAHLSGVDVAVDIHVPDLASLSIPARAPLPALKNVTATAHLGEVDGGLAEGLTLRGLAVTAPRAELSGEATIQYRGRPSLTLALSSPRFDLDALAPGADGAPKISAPVSATPAIPAPAAPPATDTAAKPAEHLVFSDRPFPLAALRAADADIELKLAAITVGGGAYRDGLLRLVLRNGHLTVDPLSAETPGGHVDGTLTADASAAVPPVAIALHARALALKPFLAGLGEPEALAGTAVVDIDLHGAGATPHGLAASADGHLGVSISDGEIDNALLATVLGDALKSPKLAEGLGLGGPGAGGRTRLRCLAARLDFVHGTATATTFLLESTRLTLQGAGTATLGDEALALRLRPQLRLGGVTGQGIALPLRIGGTLASPKVGVDAAGTIEALGSRLAAPGSAERNVESCPAALASVVASAAPAPAAATAPAAPAGAAPVAPVAAPAKLPNSAQILRGLLH